MFVDLFVKHGAGILELYHCEKLRCTMHHVMSQTWFLNFWPGPTKLYHVETMVHNVATVSAHTKLNLTLPHANTDDGHEDKTLLMKQQDSLAKLHLYFQKDMDRYDYHPLPGF